MKSVKRTNSALVGLLLGGAILTIIAVSGWGQSIMISEIMAVAFAFIAGIYAFCPHKKIPPMRKWIVSFVMISCYIIIISIMLSEFKMYKIVNFTSLFGLLIGTGIISDFKWEHINMYRSGIIVSLFALVIIYLFLPGHFLHGWNANSTIFVIPVLFLGMALIYCSVENSVRTNYFTFYCCALIGFLFIHSLDNRSSLLALSLFSIIPLCPKILNSRKWFRIIYVTIIAMGVITPFFQDYIANTGVFQNLIQLTSEKKAGGFNGREDLWHHAVELIAQNPLIGKGGWRVIYFHNFSLDVLIQYGWLGWMAFTATVISLLECCFVPGSRYNVFLYAFIILLLMNTYENAFLANNFFTIFPYFLTGIAWRYARQNQRIRI